MNIQIVDEQDTLIGTKERSELDYSVDIFRTAALWLTNSKGQVLLAKRSMKKDKDPGKWGPAVAGTIEEGETYESNIYKEAVEEIGLDGVEFSLGPKSLTHGVRRQWVQWYLAVVDRDAGGFTMQEEEVDELTWMDLEDLRNDISSNPDRYIPSMDNVLKTIYQ